MAWRTDDGGRQWRKDASAAKRSEDKRAALSEPVVKHKRKHIPNNKRKFGIEEKYIGPEFGRGLEFLQPRREWHVRWNGWYEKERDRDNALQALQKNGHAWIPYEYRPINRE